MPKYSIGLGMGILILELFLLINAEAIFPENGIAIKNVMIVYLIMQATVLAAFSQKMPTLTANLNMFLLTVVGFVGTAVLVLALPEPITGSFDLFTISSAVLTVGTVGFAFAYSFVKAFIEEVVFRGVLMQYVGITMQALLFGVFHFAMLSVIGAPFVMVLLGTVMLTALGYLWGVLARTGGILLSVGSHLCWNMASIGLLGILL